MTQFMDQDGNKDRTRPDGDPEWSPGHGTEDNADQPEQRMNANGNSGNLETEIELGWAWLLKHESVEYNVGRVNFSLSD